MIAGQTSIEELEKRIAALEDRNAIQEVTARYCFYANEKNYSGLERLFHKAQLETP